MKLRILTILCAAAAIIATPACKTTGGLPPIVSVGLTTATETAVQNSSPAKRAERVEALRITCTALEEFADGKIPREGLDEILAAQIGNDVLTKTVHRLIVAYLPTDGTLGFIKPDSPLSESLRGVARAVRDGLPPAAAK